MNIDPMENSTVAVPVELANGVIVRVQATTGETASPSTSVGEEVESDVSLNLRPLKEINDAIEGIAATIKAAIDNVKPTKATVEFGLEFELQS
ncbi:MAG TPA: CU044_2847 family protein, partial [Allocoleopsis sp.]